MAVDSQNVFQSSSSKLAPIRMGVIADLPGPGEVKEVFVQGRLVCVANLDGDLCATDNTCPHWGGPLGQGKIKDGMLVCPWHRWTFNLRTGETPKTQKVRLPLHKVLIEGDDVFLEFHDTGESLKPQTISAKP
jgi:nitrite reductase/ring-hydroxylating ferredoxin subunit